MSKNGSESLPIVSIDNYQVLEYAFMRQWGEKLDNLYYLTDFGSFKKRANEPLFYFNRIFNKLYKNILRDINPSQSTAKITHVGAFDVDFVMVFRERRSNSACNVGRCNIH
jgi:hypothetical protein